MASKQAVVCENYITAVGDEKMNEMCVCVCVWRNGGMIMRRGKQKQSRKSLCQRYAPHNKSQIYWFRPDPKPQGGEASN
jgi:hypothetical protein